jgi:hypothetical protein
MFGRIWASGPGASSSTVHHVRKHSDYSHARALRGLWLGLTGTPRELSRRRPFPGRRLECNIGSPGRINDLLAGADDAKRYGSGDARRAWCPLAAGRTQPYGRGFSRIQVLGPVGRPIIPSRSRATGYANSLSDGKTGSECTGRRLAQVAQRCSSFLGRQIIWLPGISQSLRPGLQRTLLC